jgi:FAD/FMN-containing dehydrogenase
VGGKRNIRVVVKSTGHSYMGRSIGYGSLSIWMHHFRDIEYIEDFRPTSYPFDGTWAAARIAAGHTGGEVQTELAKHNAIAITGANLSVGIVGWLTGGGHGPLTQTYGMGADHLLEATIVMPNGKVLVARPCQSTELFFAMRGGGGEHMAS